MSFTDAMAADELPGGRPMAVDVDGAPVCLVRVAGGVHAFDDVCPHRGSALSAGDLDGTTIRCAAHTWEFDVTTGTPVRMRVPDRLRLRAVREVAGRIEVEVLPAVEPAALARRGGARALPAPASTGSDLAPSPP